MNDLRSQLKRTKKSRMKSSSSVISKNLSSEFYLEYFKILKSMQDPQKFTKTIAYDQISPKRIKLDTAKMKKNHLRSQALQCNSSKRRCSRRFRPKSAPGLRKIHMINKGRRGTIDAEKLVANQFKYIEQQEDSFTDARKSYSPARGKKKSKSRKKRNTKKPNFRKSKKLHQTKEFKNTFPKILNFRVEAEKNDFHITFKEARAAFYIFVCWKISKFWKDMEDRMPTFESKSSDIDEQVSVQRYDEHIIPDTLVSNPQYSPSQNSVHHYFDNRQFESENSKQLSHQNSEPGSPEPQLDSEIGDEESEGDRSNKSEEPFGTAIKRSIQNDHEVKSQITQVLVHSTRAEEREEEVKNTEENEVYRELKKELFDNEDGQVNKILSPHNPFEAMEDTISANDKVIHLSTINTNENLGQDEINDDLSERDNRAVPSEVFYHHEEGELNHIESAVKVISQKSDNEES